jgi:hypothetical protein
MYHRYALQRDFGIETRTGARRAEPDEERAAAAMRRVLERRKTLTARLSARP